MGKKRLMETPKLTDYLVLSECVNTLVKFGRVKRWQEDSEERTPRFLTKEWLGLIMREV